jgi:hypothetical protein
MLYRYRSAFEGVGYALLSVRIPKLSAKILFYRVPNGSIISEVF